MSDLGYKKKIARAIIDTARTIYDEEIIPLHRPVFGVDEIDQVTKCIQSNFVSSVGKHVEEFEDSVASYTGMKHAIATVNGTSALHIILSVLDCNYACEVICPALTFVATPNSITYTGATPSFVDVDRETLGMSPSSLLEYLEKNAERRDGLTLNRETGKEITACIPMHTFGNPARIRELKEIAEAWHIDIIEDAAEALGSFTSGAHVGHETRASALSFNGNKIITTGGGGMVLTNDSELAEKIRHRATTSKVPHPYLFVHDEIGFNYRLPSLNAALGISQMKHLPRFLREKERVAQIWKGLAEMLNLHFVKPLDGDTSNNWLNAILVPDAKTRDDVLQATNKAGIMTRPVWTLMCDLPMYRNCQRSTLDNSRYLYDRIINLPSSVPH